MPTKATQDMPKHIQGAFVRQIVLAFQTRRARRICLLNASERFESIDTSCIFPPIQKTNSLAQNGFYL